MFYSIMVQQLDNPKLQDNQKLQELVDLENAFWVDELENNSEIVSKINKNILFPENLGNSILMSCT